MTKFFFASIAFCIALLSCSKKSETEQAISEVPVKMKVERFDKAFFDAKPEDLPRLKKQYPYFFPGHDDKVWTDKIQNPQWRELYTEVQKKYPDFKPESQKIEALFKHIKYYFPKTHTPKIITVISEMDYNNKVIYADSLLIISLELYLGRNHKFYEFPAYLKYNFEPAQLLPDIVSAWAKTKIPLPETTLLSQMVEAGKNLYLKDILLPDYTDADKIGYSSEQIKWAQENEGYIWSYFIENKLLYDTDQRLPSRFISPAPFSKFNLEIDNESPGRIGAWTGWQIVRAFMDNNKIPVDQMLKMNAKDIFERSHYKPKKDAG